MQCKYDFYGGYKYSLLKLSNKLVVASPLNLFTNGESSNQGWWHISKSVISGCM